MTPTLVKGNAPENVSRTRKRVIIGHHVILQKGLKFAQHQSLSAGFSTGVVMRKVGFSDSSV